MHEVYVQLNLQNQTYIVITTEFYFIATLDQVPYPDTEKMWLQMTRYAFTEAGLWQGQI